MYKKFKILLILIMINFLGNAVKANYEKLAYDFKFNDLDGSSLNLSEYKGKVIVVVNVASQCGFTNQYEDMQNIWEKYQSKGLVVIGVPSNDFNQESESSPVRSNDLTTEGFSNDLDQNSKQSNPSTIEAQQTPSKCIQKSTPNK